MKIALLGVSHWHAGMHAEAVQNSGATLCAHWDIRNDITQGFAGRFGGQAAPDVGSALSGADLAVIMGHPADVPEIALQALETGLPLILEKPAACDTAAFDRIVEAAAKRGNFVAVALPNRLGPAMAEYRRLADAGAAGPIAHAHFRIVNGPPQRYRDDGVGWVLDPAAGGGGALRNLGIHGIDCALGLAQGPLTPCAVHIGKRIHAGEAVEDHAFITLTDAAGTLFTVEAGYTYASMAPGGDFEWRIAAANAYLTDNGLSAHATVLDPAQSYALPPLAPAVRYTAFMVDTLARLQAGQPPLVGLTDYLAAMTLIDTLYKDIQS